MHDIRVVFNYINVNRDRGWVGRDSYLYPIKCSLSGGEREPKKTFLRTEQCFLIICLVSVGWSWSKSWLACRAKRQSTGIRLVSLPIKYDFRSCELTARSINSPLRRMSSLSLAITNSTVHHSSVQLRPSKLGSNALDLAPSSLRS